MSPLRKVQFGQTVRYFEILTSLFRQTQHIAFTRVNSGVKISKSLDFDQILTFRSKLFHRFFQYLINEFFIEICDETTKKIVF